MEALRRMTPLELARMVSPITTLSAWRMTQGIYRFDPALYVLKRARGRADLAGVWVRADHETDGTPCLIITLGTRALYQSKGGEA